MSYGQMQQFLVSKFLLKVVLGLLVSVSIHYCETYIGLQENKANGALKTTNKRKEKYI